ncbi:MAG: DUF4097 domain-containing protein [Ruminococcaceae bacterium]|nr:DUF4097 domain-containing protein [Oscillospiraceae bacterium]
MNRSTKIWLIIAAFLVLLGLITFAVALSAYNWDFTKLSTVNYEINTQKISDSFTDISIKTDTSNIVFVPTDDRICKVVCYEEENAKHSVNVQNGTLTIKLVNKKKWYEHIGINFGEPNITVYLPNTEYNSLYINESTGDIEIPKSFIFKEINISTSTGNVKNYASAIDNVKIKTSTGDIIIDNMSAGTLELSVSTGDVVGKFITCNGDIKINVSTGNTNLEKIKCKSVISNGSTGNIFLKDVIAEEKFSIKRDTGYVKFEKCDASKIYVTTDTGNVTGSLLSDKVFIIETDTGNINVPKTSVGGRCEITTDTGDIKISIK